MTAVTDAACLHATPRGLIAQRMFTVTVHILAQRSKSSLMNPQQGQAG